MKKPEKKRRGRPPLMDEGKLYSFRVPVALMETLDGRAKREGITRSGLLRHLLEESLRAENPALHSESLRPMPHVAPGSTQRDRPTPRVAEKTPPCKYSVIQKPWGVLDDGGRVAAGFKGETGDCATRAIAIALQIPYLDVYNELAKLSGQERPRKGHRPSHPRTGVNRKVYERFLADRGWRFIPTMGIGTGCKVHLRPAELPRGHLIVRASKHVVAVVNGVIHDNHDSTRDGTRCVYGYWKAA